MRISYNWTKNRDILIKLALLYKDQGTTNLLRSHKDIMPKQRRLIRGYILMYLKKK